MSLVMKANFTLNDTKRLWTQFQFGDVGEAETNKTRNCECLKDSNVNKKTFEESQKKCYKVCINLFYAWHRNLNEIFASSQVAAKNQHTQPVTMTTHPNLKPELSRRDCMRVKHCQSRCQNYIETPKTRAERKFELPLLVSASRNFTNCDFERL